MAMQQPKHALLLCPLCDKPFTKDVQYKRHTAYCRKSRVRKRPRSCLACNQSKVKCDFNSPCHQCKRKKIECVFDRNRAWENTELDVATSSISRAEFRPPSSIEDSNFQLFGSINGTNQDSLVPYINGPASGDDSNHYPLNTGAEVPFTTLVAETTLQDGSFMGMALLNDSFNDLSPTIFADMNFQLENCGTFFSEKELQLSSRPSPDSMALESPKAMSSTHFSKNSVKTAVHQIHASMITNMILAYPRMMARCETLPPFVHSHSSSKRDGDRLPVNLANCMGISQLFVQKTKDTTKFIWATIRAEMRAMRDHLYTMDKYEALSAIQACLLYFIIRAGETSLPQDIKEDYEMVLIYEAVSVRVVDLSNSFCQDISMSLNVLWTDWIFRESYLRVACVWFVLNLICHARTGKPCYPCDHFRELSLPCTKAEWEAKTEEQWKIERANAKAKSTSSLRKFGDLIDAEQHFRGSIASEALAEWNTGIDHLGMVLNLAAHMV